MKKRLVAFLLVLIMVLGMLPVSAFAADDGVSPQALESNETQTIKYQILYVGDEFNIGYNYGASVNKTYTCQYSTGHSGFNHSILISEFRNVGVPALKGQLDSGYEFVGWAKEAKKNPTIFDFNTAGTTATQTTYTIYLVAKKTNPTPTYMYYLYYKYNDGTDSTWLTDVTDRPTAATTFTFNVNRAKLTRSGYDHIGWADKADAVTAKYTGGDPIVLTKDNPTKTIYAIWMPFFELKYDANGGTGAPDSQTYTSYSATSTQATFTSRNQIPTKDGYTFKSWADSAAATTAQYQPGGTIAVKHENSPKTVYAVWEKNDSPVPDNPGGTKPDVANAQVKICVQCIEDSATHQPKNYGILAGAYVDGLLQVDGTYYYSITLNRAKYIEKFDQDSGKTHTDTEPNESIEFKWQWKNGKWELISDIAPVIKVKCDTTTKPSKPALNEGSPVLVQCVQAGTHTDSGKDSAKKYFALGGYAYRYEEVKKEGSNVWKDEADNKWTYQLKLKRDEFVKAYNNLSLVTTHTDTNPGEETYVTWKHDGTSWKLVPAAGQTSAGIGAVINVKCTPVPTSDEPTLANTDLNLIVKCVTNNAAHSERSMPLKAGTFKMIGTVQDRGPLKFCTIEVETAQYVAEFDTDRADTHTAAKTIRVELYLKKNDSTAKWTNNKSATDNVIEVTCEPKAPTADELKKLEMAVQVKCVVDASQQHTAAYGLLGECDVDYFVFEPRQEGDDWLCDISYYPERYVAEFNTTFQNLKHVQNDEKIVPVTLIWAGGSWQIKTQGRVHVTEEYTVTYTDGVDGEEVFADQVYSDLRKDSTTPAFNGTPTRTGYTFAGWEPEVAETVTETVTYAAKWTPVEPTHDDIFKALNGLVTVTCINRFWKDGNKNMDCGQGQYAAKAGIAGQEYTLEKGENAGTWVVTFPVTNFVKSFKQDPAHNLYTKDTLRWYIRWENNAWTSAPVEPGVDDLVKLTHAPTDWREVAKIATGGKSDCIHTLCKNSGLNVCDYGITVPFVNFNEDVVSVVPEEGKPGSYIATFRVDKFVDARAKVCNDKNFPDAPRTHKLLTQETVRWRLYATSEADEKIGNNVLNHVWAADPVTPGTDDVCEIAHNWVVTFDPNGGTPVPLAQEVEYGHTATKPVEPTLKGYTFDGWYLDGEEEPFDFGTTITSDITLTAKWHVTLHNIYAYARLNSYFAPLTTSEFDTPVTLNEATLSRLGLGSYNSLGYISIGSFDFDAMPLTDDLYFDDDPELAAAVAELTQSIALETGVSEDTAKKIAWTVLYKTVNKEDMAPGYPADDGYQLSGNLNLATVMFKAGGENVTGMPAVNYTYDEAVEIHDFYFAGDTFTMPADPTREGYSFEGWSVEVLRDENDADHLDADGADDAADETLLKAGDTYTITKGGVIFTAQWKLNTYIIASDLRINGDTANLADGKTYAWTHRYGGNYGETIDYQPMFDALKARALEADKANEPNPTKVDVELRFPGSKDRLFNEEIHTYGQDGGGWNPGVKNTAYIWGYAWTYYDVTFVTGVDGLTVEPQLVKSGDKATAPTDVTRLGYDFKGWYTDEALTVQFAFDTPITRKTTLYAKWEARTDTPYKVKYYIEKLDGTYDYNDSYEGRGTTDTRIDATKVHNKSYENFTLDLNHPDTVQFGNIAGDGSLVLKLFYTRNTYDYTVRHIKQLPDGSYDEANAEVETLSGKFEALAAVTAKDYGSHYPTNDADTKQNIKIEKGLTIDVKYALDEHTLTFETNGGSAINPVTVRHGNAVARPADPTKDKYTFIGWYVDPEFTAKYDFATVLEADKTIYAKFELTSTPIGDIYVRYDVLHIKQLPDGTYDLANAEVEHLSAKKDSTVTAVIKDYRATHHVNVNRTLSKLTGTAIQPYMGVDGKPVYTILTVYYDLDFHTLTFDTMGGSKIAPETVRHGLTVAKPKDPVNGGYIFDGWYTDKTFRTPYNFATPLTQDTTIYAKWFLIVLPGVTVKKNTPKLNTADHFAYVQGYPDGTVKPAGNITRAETAAILFRLMDDASRKTYYSTKSGFRDVASGSWYNTYVATLNNAGVITDSSNGYFRPNEAITRAELAAMLAKFSETTGAANYFNDVSAKYWAANAIAICAKLGWINGYPDGTFRPDKNVTRAELMAMINRATGRAPKSADAFLPGMKTWSDNTADKWYYLDVQEATNSHSYTVKGSETWTALTSDPNWSLYE